MYKLSVFIFRNDLRLEDNTALIEALRCSREVIPIFIFNKNQITEKNEYRSLNSMQFMKKCLEELNQTLIEKNSSLYMFYDRIDNVLKELREKLKIEAVYINEDYTPFARKRDHLIQKFCEENNIELNKYQDKLLNHPKATIKADGKPYTIFTPFYKKNVQTPIKIPKENNFNNYFKEKIQSSIETFPEEFNACSNPNLLVKGGRKEALELIEKIRKISDYDLQRNFPSIKGTSHLSAHLKFGTISPREALYFIKEIFDNEHPLIRQLYWRDFWYSIAYHFPYVFQSSFNKKYDKIKWENNSENFSKWCEGRTGFPIVDAGMRELNETGYMHNRVRMIVSSFLVKDLHIDWRLGEKYFASKLTDYDPCLNNGNWQWAASTGCDAQPYFRIFNPWSQQKKFDEDCTYIKKWIPELSKLNSKAIHFLEEQRPLIQIEYPKPIVEHKTQSQIAKAMFKEV